MSKWNKQLKDECQGKTPKASALKPEKIEIQLLKKRIKYLEEEKDILKKATLDVGLIQQFQIVQKIQGSYSIKRLCKVW